MEKKKFLTSAAVLSIGGVLAKGIGAAYRIPLYNLLGGYGIGLYQMAYPLFCVLLTFSSAGIPSAFSRTIARETAQGRTGADALRAALKQFAILGLFGTALMYLFAPLMSQWQGDDRLLRCYYMLAPSVFLVSMIAVLRGYFQGKNDMRPTALSEILEQLVKAVVGGYFALRFRGDPARAVMYCLLAVTISECAALVYLLTQARGMRREKCLIPRPIKGVEVLYSALPVMVATSLLPLSQMLDSVFLVRLLSRHSENAVALYGLFTGGAISLVGLPATACYGLAAASVPAVAQSFARGEREEGRDRALYALCITFLLSLPCALGLFFLAKPIAAILYSGLSASDAKTLVFLIRMTSVSAVSLAGIDTLAACLTGMGRAKSAALAMLFAILAKFALQWSLVGNPRFSIGGAALAANVCYLVAFFLDLYYTLRKTRGNVHDNGREFRGRKGRRERKSALDFKESGQSACKKRVAGVGGAARGGDFFRDA